MHLFFIKAIDVKIQLRKKSAKCKKNLEEDTVFLYLDSTT